MNKRIQQMWVKALLSGKFEQQKGRLKGKDNKRCCLGVLCEIHRQEFPENKWFGRHKTLYMNDSYLLSDQILDWAALDDSDHTELGHLNDQSNITFIEIAGVIERL